MVLQDQGGGHISTVTYGSKDPITKTLKTFSIDLTSNPTLGRSAQPGPRRDGRGRRPASRSPASILGVETPKKAVGKDETIDVDMLNLLTDDGLRSVPLDSVGADQAARTRSSNKELRQALAVLATGPRHRQEDRHAPFPGRRQAAGPRRLHPGNAHLEDQLSAGAQGRARRRCCKAGPSSRTRPKHDWNDVDLTLVSGRPISFMMNLYDPLYVQRPVVEPELFASLRPQTYGQDLAEREKRIQRGRGGCRRRRGRRPWRIAGEPAREGRCRPMAAAGRRPSEPMSSRATRMRPFNLQQGVQSLAAGRATSASCFNTRSTRRSRCRGRSRPCCRSSTNRSKAKKFRSTIRRCRPSIRSTACG